MGDTFLPYGAQFQSWGNACRLWGSMGDQFSFLEGPVFVHPAAFSFMGWSIFVYGGCNFRSHTSIFVLGWWRGGVPFPPQSVWELGEVTSSHTGECSVFCCANVALFLGFNLRGLREGHWANVCLVRLVTSHTQTDFLIQVSNQKRRMPKKYAH